jgi:hypothetical protein
MWITENPTPYAVGWFTLALINAGLAQTKGKRGIDWWFFSLFLGPICTFIIVVMEPPHQKQRDTG